MTNLALLIQQLAKQPTETPWLEFKHNNADPQMIGADISALANSATLHDRDCAYMIWGINDQTHEIIGTDIRLKQLKKGNQEIINRIIDNPPKSRNEKLASLMRRFRMCEELGRGWDRMVITCEQQFLTAPRIVLFDESTKVIIYSHIDFSKMSVEDKLWSCYMHACVQYLQDDFMNNSSLRQRYNAPDTMTGSISRLIKQAVEKGLIKPFDSNTAPRYMRYIPFWA